MSVVPQAAAVDPLDVCKGTLALSLARRHVARGVERACEVLPSAVVLSATHLEEGADRPALRGLGGGGGVGGPGAQAPRSDTTPPSAIAARSLPETLNTFASVQRAFIQSPSASTFTCRGERPSPAGASAGGVSASVWSLS